MQEDKKNNDKWKAHLLESLDKGRHLWVMQAIVENCPHGTARQSAQHAMAVSTLLNPDAKPVG